MVTLQVRTLVRLAAALAVAVIVLLGFRALRADAVGEGESAFVPVTPCRLFDTRSGSFNVGLRSVPLGVNESHAFMVVGSNGECSSIPAAATAVAINLTGVGATADTFVSVYPAGVKRPNTSAVNLVAGQPPTPNKVDVKLSSDGRLAVYNAFGSVDVIGDVLGYYRSDGLTDLEARLAELEAAGGSDADVVARLADLEATVSDLETAHAQLVAQNSELAARVDALETTTASMSVTEADGSPVVRFTGVNVQVVDGSGDTDGSVTGVGNLIVGYNAEVGSDADRRYGSHNLVVGDGHRYTSFGGLVAGFDNFLTGESASVSGGSFNTAGGTYASVSGGTENHASGLYASISGGYDNGASGNYSAVSGGTDNIAYQAASSVSGGVGNSANGYGASILGGSGNTVTGAAATVSGGSFNSAAALYASVSGGTLNIADGEQASVSGGSDNTASGQGSSVSGGAENLAIGQGTSILGGSKSEASGNHATVSGGTENSSAGLGTAIAGGKQVVVTGDYEIGI